MYRFATEIDILAKKLSDSLNSTSAGILSSVLWRTTVSKMTGGGDLPARGSDQRLISNA